MRNVLVAMLILTTLAAGPALAEAPLTDQDAIIAMVQQGMNLDAARDCYTERLHSKELQGSWVLLFTVATDGSAKDVEVIAQSASDETLEACLRRVIRSWDFAPIAHELPVKKTVTFRPGDAMAEATAGSASNLVTTTVQKNFHRVTPCYDSALERNLETEGTVVVDWVVDHGVVQYARVHSNDTGDRELGACVAGEMATWTLPEGIDGQILYPFVFKTSGE